MKLFFDRIKRKKVPEKKSSKPIEIQIEGFIELSNLIILSYTRSNNELIIRIDSIAVGIESKSVIEPKNISSMKKKKKSNVEYLIIFLKVTF